MEKLTGIASNVKHHFDFDAAGARSCLAEFQIGDLWIDVYTATRSHIDDGEMVAVAGTFRRGRFSALAYENLSTEVQGDAGHWPVLAFGCCLLVAAALLAGVTVIGALIFVAVGIFMLVHATRIGAAKQMLEGDD